MVGTGRTQDLARNIVLIGPMGSGKSTVGSALARRLGRPHVDTDHFFVARHGSIAEYFTTHGEEAFRAEEEKVVAELLDSPRPSVISLGGGSILSPRTRETLSSQLVVMLDLTEQQARQRLGDGSTRPVLGDDPVSSWRRIYAEREALYRECADVVVPPAEGTIDERVDTIVSALRAVH
ncbi:shikimate kinase [Nesterenkonia sp. CL21]|uniref:shikimate kinase n=1 Tax=unclassified Nesterenkonia TaxID=2629769 RepID=UPI002878CF3B|nr:shikimate kinase [Nesterenkonia sp. CL21]MDS2171749.1 shikimate kinase [Nesterenkonia sp. CL21]